MPNRLASAVIVSLLVLLGTGCLKNPSAVSGGSSTGMSCQSASPTAPGSPAMPYDAATLRETLGAICPAFGGLYFDASTLVVTSRPDGIEDVAAAVERYNATRSNVPPMRFTSVARIRLNAWHLSTPRLRGQWTPSGDRTYLWLATV